MKTFKSERAAKMAYTKAEKAWQKACRDASGARWAMYRDDNGQPRGWTDEEEAAVNALDVEASRLGDIASDVYTAAREQGHYIYSYHFGVNYTRDLIAANMD